MACLQLGRSQGVGAGGSWAERSLPVVVWPGLVLLRKSASRRAAQRREEPRMPAKKDENESDGFCAEERDAMKERAAELRAEGKKGTKRADGLQAVLDAIAKMALEDRALAERVHVTVAVAGAGQGDPGAPALKEARRQGLAARPDRAGLDANRTRARLVPCGSVTSGGSWTRSS